MQDILRLCNAKLNHSKPKHLLGIGKMADIEMAIKYNIDTFDCVHPTRIARHGGALVSRKHWIKRHDNSYQEHISLTNACFKYDHRPIDETCGCEVCQKYKRSYLHYLLMAKEILAMILLTKHNVHFMNNFMRQIRQNISISE